MRARKAFTDYGKLLENMNLTETQIIYTGRKWHPLVKEYLEELIDFTLNLHTRKHPNSIKIHWFSDKKVGGHVTMSSEACETQNFELGLDKRNSFKSVSKLLSHELYHIKQMLDGDLQIVYGNEIYWKEYIYNLDQYNSDHDNMPWEVEAIKFQDSNFDRWISSPEYKAITDKIDKALQEKYSGMIRYEDVKLIPLPEFMNMLNK